MHNVSMSAESFNFDDPFNLHFTAFAVVGENAGRAAFLGGYGNSHPPYHTTFGEWTASGELESKRRYHRRIQV